MARVYATPLAWAALALLALTAAAGCDRAGRFASGGVGCLGDQEVRPPWIVEFAGGGCVRVESGEVALAPAPVEGADRTRAALVVGQAVGPEFRLRLRTITDAQLRTGAEPNPWEAAWVVWDYLDDEHFYYLVLKPNGWEIGKRDPAYPGGQRFLATGATPSYPLGRWYAVEVQRKGGRTAVAAAGVPLATFADSERPYRGGRVGLYTEDAAVRFDDVRVDAGRGALPSW